MQYAVLHVNINYSKYFDDDVDLYSISRRRLMITCYHVLQESNLYPTFLYQLYIWYFFSLRAHDWDKSDKIFVKIAAKDLSDLFAIEKNNRKNIDITTSILGQCPKPEIDV